MACSWAVGMCSRQWAMALGQEASGRQSSVEVMLENGTDHLPSHVEHPYVVCDQSQKAEK